MPHRIAAKITGVAGYLPPKVMTNADFEKILDTSDEWIRTRTGIRERHIVEAGKATSDMATEWSCWSVCRLSTPFQPLGWRFVGAVTWRLVVTVSEPAVAVSVMSLSAVTELVETGKA